MDYKWKIGKLDRSGCFCFPHVPEYTLMNHLDTVLKPENWKLTISPVNDYNVFSLLIRMNNEWISKDSYSFTESCQLWGYFREILAMDETWIKTIKDTITNTYYPMHDVLNVKTPCPPEYLIKNPEGKPTIRIKASKIHEYITKVLI